MTGPAGPQVLHATCVADDGGRGLLILGASGAGKSALALQMIGLGARLVSDDLTALAAGPDGPVATCPSQAAQGLIEARGVGLLRVPALPRAVIRLAVDLDQVEQHRLPPQRSIQCCGCKVDVVFGPVRPHLPAALWHLLRAGRQD